MISGFLDQTLPFALWLWHLELLDEYNINLLVVRIQIAPHHQFITSSPKMSHIGMLRYKVKEKHGHGSKPCAARVPFIMSF